MPEKSEIQESIITRIQYEMGEPTVLPHTHLKEDLQMDSLERVELVMGIEKQFDITITDQELADFASVQDIIDVVYTRVKDREE